MALFSSNRKVRSRRPKSAQEAPREMSPQRRTRRLSKQNDALKSQIHRLECYITDAPRIERQRRLENVNMVPPMDLPSPAPRQQRATIAKRRAQRGERLRLAIEALLVLGSITAVVGWLNQWWHF